MDVKLSDVLAGETARGVEPQEDPAVEGLARLGARERGGNRPRWRGRRPSGPPTRGARRRTSLAAGPDTRITATPARPGAEESAYTVSPGATSRAPEVEHVSEEELARRAAARRAASGGGGETGVQDARASREAKGRNLAAAASARRHMPSPRARPTHGCRALRDCPAGLSRRTRVVGPKRIPFRGRTPACVVVSRTRRSRRLFFSETLGRAAADTDHARRETRGRYRSRRHRPSQATRRSAAGAGPFVALGARIRPGVSQPRVQSDRRPRALLASPNARAFEARWVSPRASARIARSTSEKMRTSRRSRRTPPPAAPSTSSPTTRSSSSTTTAASRRAAGWP